MKCFIIILFVISPLLTFAAENYDDRILIVTIHLGCENLEAKNDIIYASKQLSAFAKQHNIKFITRNKKGKCGYTLGSTDKKYIHGALTDYDLMLAIKNYIADR